MVALQVNDNSDFYTEVVKGNVPGHTIVHKFGRNDTVPNGSWAPVTLLGTVNHLTTATTIRIKAGGNAADTAAGAGTREIVVIGLDATGAEQSSVIATAGASASAVTSESYIRVFRAYSSANGTYATPVNTGAIIIEDSAGTADLISIAAGEGQTQYAGYTIPLGKMAYPISMAITVDSNKAADIRMFQRLDMLDTSAPLGSQRVMLYFDGVSGITSFSPKSPWAPVAALTDLWVEAQGNASTAEVSADFELLIVDD